MSSVTHKAPHCAPHYPAGSSHGQCVPRAGTSSKQVCDAYLLGIPHSWEIIAIPQSKSQMCVDVQCMMH